MSTSTKKKPIGKTLRPQAERAGEWYLIEECQCIITRRALRTKYAKVDFYGSDIIGKKADGSCVYAQVTAGGSEALRVRRRKLEKVPWHLSETVILLQLEYEIDSSNARKKIWKFRRHNYNHVKNVWTVDKEKIIVPREWFKAYKGEQNE